VPFQDGRKDAKVHGVFYIERKNKVDLPGVRYVVKRGWGDLPGVTSARQGRSLRGTKKPEKNQ
jgi:ribosomal protein S12